MIHVLRVQQTLMRQQGAETKAAASLCTLGNANVELMNSNACTSVRFCPFDEATAD